jgi:sugar phosphate isomerase/epimerase
MKPDRRKFLQIATAGTLALTAGPTVNARRVSDPNEQTPTTPAQAPKPLFELGLASYTCRSLSLAQTLVIANRVNLTHIALKDVHLPLSSTPAQIQAAAAQVRAAGLDLYGGGVIYMYSETDVNQAFDYAKIAGMRVIIGVPLPNLLPLVDRRVKEYDIKVALHNHGPGDITYPTPETVYESIKNFDQRIGLCNDVGHTARSGLDVAATIAQFGDRLLDVHMKDETVATGSGTCTEAGRGVIDLPAVMRALVKINYTGLVSFEYEKPNFDKDPLPGLAESVGYIRGIMAAI